MKKYSTSIFVTVLSVFSYSQFAQAMCLKSLTVSGGEDHTMVLTEDGSVFTCGLDSVYGNYSGVLGIGNVSGSYKDTLFQVLEGNMQTDSDYLENISDISAGWTHSLALDEDGFVWAWGGNLYGQLGLTGNMIVFDTEVKEILTTDCTDYTDFNEYSP